MRLALAQMRMDPDRERNVACALDLMTAASAGGAHAILFPELTFDRFFPQYANDARHFDLAEPVPGPTVDRLAAHAAALGLVTLPNLLERQGDRYFDSTPAIDADGRLIGRARMMHVAEMPGFHEQFYYAPGDTGAVVVRTAAAAIGIAICYDRHYPEHMRALALAGAELIVVPNAAVEGEPLELFEIEIRAAAFQQQLFVALVNRVGEEGDARFAGRSLVADPHGRVIARAPHGEDALVFADLDLSLVAEARQLRPYLRDRRHGLYAL
jgi:N-carbamoylputrescine amidase